MLFCLICGSFIVVQCLGVRYEIKVKPGEDLNRQVVKGEFATISIPKLELEIPKESQPGSINTIEGMLPIFLFFLLFCYYQAL